MSIFDYCRAHPKLTAIVWLSYGLFYSFRFHDQPTWNFSKVLQLIQVIIGSFSFVYWANRRPVSFDKNERKIE